MMKRQCSCVMGVAAAVVVFAALGGEDLRAVAQVQGRIETKGPPPRVLENESSLRTRAVTWEELVFSPDGKSLAGDGERPLPQANSLKHVGMTRETEEFVQIWNLTTFRAQWADRMSDNTARRMAPRFTAESTGLYANAQENQGRDDLDAGGGRNEPAFARGVRNSTAVLFWPLNVAKAEIRRMPAAPDGLFIASHVAPGGKSMLLIQPSVGIQKYAISRKTNRSGLVTTELNPDGPPLAINEPITQPAFFSADGSALVANLGTDRPSILVWDVQGRKVKARFEAPAPGHGDNAKTKTKAFTKKKAANKKGAPEKNARKGDNDDDDPPANRRGGGPAVRKLTASADASVVAIALRNQNGHHLIVLETATSKVVHRVGPLPRPVVGVSLTAQGDRLVYATDLRLAVLNVADGSEYNLPTEGAKLTAAAVSPDGRLVAAAGDDGAVRLWKLDGDGGASDDLAAAKKERAGGRPNSPPTVRTVGPGGTPLVAMGPIDVRATRPGGAVVPLKLVRLTPETALFSPISGGRLVRENAVDRHYVKIETADGKQTWTVDAAKKTYDGPTLPAPSFPEIPAPQAATPDQEQLYLLMGARQTMRTAMSLTNDLRESQRPAITSLRNEVMARQSYLKQQTGSPAGALATLYDDLARWMDDLDRASDEQRTVLAAINRDAIAAAAERSHERTQATAGRLLGVGMMLAGGLKGKGEYLGSETSNNVTTHYYEEYDYFPGWAEAGGEIWLNSTLESSQRQARLAAAESIADEKNRDGMTRALKARNDAIDAFRRRWDDLAVKEFGLPRPSDPPVGKPNPAKLADWLEAEAKKNRGRANRDELYDQVDAILTRSLAPGGKMSPGEARFQQAQNLAALTALVPPGKIHDAERARLLAVAAGLALRAVSKETGDRPCLDAYNTKALYAMKLLDRAATLAPGDPTGLIRDERALALAQAGRGDEAIAQARQLAADRPTASALVTLARLECATGQVDRGLDHLEEAILKRKFLDLDEVRKMADFPRGHDRFQSLTQIRLKVQGISLGRSIKIQNDGLFPLYNVSFQAKYFDTFNHNRERTAEASLHVLNPGQTYILAVETPAWVVSDTIDGRKTKVWKGALSATAPGQGTASFPIAAPTD